jgi:hypothetical protein
VSRSRDIANFDPSLLANDEVSLDKLGTSGTLDVSSATLTTSEELKYKSIHMTGLIPVLVEAVKELSAKVTALEGA